MAGSGGGLSGSFPGDPSGVISNIATTVSPSITAKLPSITTIGLGILAVLVVIALVGWLKRVIAGVDEKGSPGEQPFFDDWTEGYGEVQEEGMAATCTIWIDCYDDRHSQHDVAMSWCEDDAGWEIESLSAAFPNEEIEVEPEEYEAHTGQQWMPGEESL